MSNTENKQKESELKSKYHAKLKAAFNSKWVIYLFHCVTGEQVSPSIEGFEHFQLSEHESVIDLYTTKYYQYQYDKELIPGKTVRNVLDAITALEKDNQPLKNECKKGYKPLTLSEYLNVVDVPDAHCGYCGVTQKEIDKLNENGLIRNKAETRGFSLELDRKKPNQEYTADNIILACYWCNNAKTDEFSLEEFKPIATGIQIAWKNRGAKIHPNFKYPTQ